MFGLLVFKSIVVEDLGRLSHCLCYFFIITQCILTEMYVEMFIFY